MQERLKEVEACDLCQGREFDPELTAGNWTLKRCRACGLVFTSPRYTDAALSALYAESYYETTSGYMEVQREAPSPDDLRIARYAARLLPHARTHPRSLELGCGAGRLVSAFAQVGFEAQGMEPSSLAAAAGRRAGRNIVQTPLEEFAGDQFDCVTAFNVLEHVPAPTAFLRQCHRVLKARGILLLEVPNYGSGAARALRDKWIALYPDTHLYHFTAPTLQALLAKTRLSVVALRWVGGRG